MYNARFGIQDYPIFLVHPASQYTQPHVSKVSDMLYGVYTEEVGACTFRMYQALSSPPSPLPSLKGPRNKARGECPCTPLLQSKEHEPVVCLLT